MTLPITLFNHPVLRKKGSRVEHFDTNLRTLAEEMIETMHENQGIGLAAQQVGRTLQLCVVDVRESDWDFDYRIDGKRPPLDLIMPLVIVNPKVTPINDGPPSSCEEGCLSFPDIRGEVKRPEKIHLRFQDLEGNEHTLDCDGILSRCVQHEVDHLNGILFIDRMEKKTLVTLDKKLKNLKRQSRDLIKQSE